VIVPNLQVGTANVLCESGMAMYSHSQRSWVCETAPYSLSAVPTECYYNSDCRYEFRGSVEQTSCKCGYNPDGKAYCYA
jgi:hypothetical protein